MYGELFAINSGLKSDGKMLAVLGEQLERFPKVRFHLQV